MKVVKVLDDRLIADLVLTNKTSNKVSFDGQNIVVMKIDEPGVLSLTFRPKLSKSSSEILKLSLPSNITLYKNGTFSETVEIQFNSKIENIDHIEMFYAGVYRTSLNSSSDYNSSAR